METTQPDGTVIIQQPDGAVETLLPGSVPAPDVEEGSTMSVVVALVEPSAGISIFANPALPFLPNGSITLDLANWDGIGPLTVFVDRDGDGITDETIFVDNEPVAILLSQQLSALDIILTLGELGPYLSQVQVEAILTRLSELRRNQAGGTLTTLGLDGDDLGEIIAAIGSANMTNEQLADFIGGLDLQPDELAHLVFELNLPPSELAALIDALDLPPETLDTLNDELASIDEVDQVLIEWETLNLPDEQLPEFLSRQDLVMRIK